MDRADVVDQRSTAGMMGMPRFPPSGRPVVTHYPAVSSAISATLPAAVWVGTRVWGMCSACRITGNCFHPTTGLGAPNAFAGVQPEKPRNWMLVRSGMASYSNAWVSAYAGRIQDYILFRYMSGGMMGMTSIASNIDARICGFEAGGELRPGQGLDAGRQRGVGMGREYGCANPLYPQMTPLEGRFSAAWDNGQWSAGVLLRAVAAQSQVSLNQGNVTGRDLGPSAGFATLALNASYRLNARMQ